MEKDGQREAAARARGFAGTETLFLVIIFYSEMERLGVFSGVEFLFSFPFPTHI